MAEEDPNAADERGRSGRTPGVFDRIFPGPAPRDPRVAARLDAIARATEQRAQRMQQRHASRSESRTSGPASSPEMPTQDLDRLVDALHEQTDLVRALLDADIAIRDDARATAQNSRTFAIAGTVIALFTMIAAVVTVVIAFAD